MPRPEEMSSGYMYKHALHDAYQVSQPMRRELMEACKHHMYEADPAGVEVLVAEYLALLFSRTNL